MTTTDTVELVDVARSHGFTEEPHVDIFTRQYERALTAVREWRQRYDDDVRDWYENGDGAAPNWQRAGDQEWFTEDHGDPDRMVNLGGRGYAYPYCIHGTSRWTDYDNICGGCEDSHTDEDLAIARAAEITRTYLTRARAWVDFICTVGSNTLPGDLAGALIAYVSAPLTEPLED